MIEGTVLWQLADEIQLDRQVALSTLKTLGFIMKTDEYYQPIVAQADISRAKEVLIERRNRLRDNRSRAAEIRSNRSPEVQAEIDRLRAEGARERAQMRTRPQEAPQAEEPQAEEPQAEAPQVEAPQAKEPQVEEPEPKPVVKVARAVKSAGRKAVKVAKKIGPRPSPYQGMPGVAGVDYPKGIRNIAPEHRKEVARLWREAKARSAAIDSYSAYMYQGGWKEFVAPGLAELVTECNGRLTAFDLDDHPEIYVLIDTAEARYALARLNGVPYNFRQWQRLGESLSSVYWISDGLKGLLRKSAKTY